MRRYLKSVEMPQKHGNSGDLPYGLRFRQMARVFANRKDDENDEMQICICGPVGFSFNQSC